MGMKSMIETYVVKCNLHEVNFHTDRVIDVVRGQKCLGYGGTGEEVIFYFADRGQAMMTFLEFDFFLSHVFVDTSPLFINKKKLKGVFVYD